MRAVVNRGIVITPRPGVPILRRREWVSAKSSSDPPEDRERNRYDSDDREKRHHALQSSSTLVERP